MTIVQKSRQTNKTKQKNNRKTIEKIERKQHKNNKWQLQK